MLEFAIFLPILLLLIAGLIEIGAYANVYMEYLDASREAARFGANLDPEETSAHRFDYRVGYPPFPDVTAMSQDELRMVCRQGETTNFFYEVACLAMETLPYNSLDPSQGDDIVISVIRVKTGGIVDRWPSPTFPERDPNDPAYHFRGSVSGRYCWSLYGTRESEFDNAELAGRLRAGAPNTGFVIVEIFHLEEQFTRFFTIGDFLPDPIPLHVYSVFPVSAAEPRD
jgi:hypothetical protein